MNIIRPVKSSDLAQLIELSHQAGHGLTTLSTDPERLEKQIQLSEASFKKEVLYPWEEYYLFVLVDGENGKVRGTSALEAAVGTVQPFYTYNVGIVSHSSPNLGIHNPMKILLLGNDYTGTTELCTLFLAPEFRRGLNGRLLSKSRFLFMAQFPERFADRVIAELRGYSDAKGRSPFWDGLGSKFFTLSFTEADRISGLGSNQFIAELMPKHPVYIDLLPKTAQDVIGKTHPDTQPALKLLQKDGFRYHGYVDIFDGGPTIECDTDNIVSINQSNIFQFKIVDKIDDGETCFVSNLELAAFRATVAEIKPNGHNSFEITQAMADSLNLNQGDAIRVTPVL